MRIAFEFRIERSFDERDRESAKIESKRAFARYIESVVPVIMGLFDGYREQMNEDLGSRAQDT